MRRCSVLFLACFLPAGALHAQAPPPDESLLEAAQESHELEDAHEFAPPPPGPWTIALWAPANWRSNRTLASRNPVRGVSLDPELSAFRRWNSGRLAFFAEGGLFLSAMLPDAARNSSGWWGTAEASLDNPAERISPYFAYEPRGVYAGVFDDQIATFHNLTLGVRRQWGPTALNLFVRRMQANRPVADQFQVAAHAQHTWPLQGGLSFNLRGDGEWRSFDRFEDARRRDIRARLRARLFVPLHPAVDLVLTADVQRHWSTVERFQFTSIFIGPAISARLRR